MILLWPLLFSLLRRQALVHAQNFNNSTALQYDPVLSMCARWNHQSILKGNTLYIDGGAESFYAGTDDIFLGLNDYLIVVDMSESWDWSTNNISIQIINKTAASPTPPTSVGGALFQGTTDDNRVFLYGGADFTSNTTAHNGTDPGPTTLWTYDVDNGTWAEIEVSDAGPWKPNRGTYAEASDHGLGFYFNGAISKEIDIGQWGLLASDTAHLEGMIVIDTANKTGQFARNISTIELTGGSPRTGAGMTYTPELGDAGSLVLIGGLSREANFHDDTAAGVLIGIEDIAIFDIASYLSDPSGSNGTWYIQTATGDIPELRTDFCLVSTTAPDKSSFNIWLYGGRNPKSNVIFDDVYVLSMPSFVWIKVFTGQTPRWGHTCHMIPNSRQLLTSGGSLVSEPSTLTSSGCDWERKAVAILDTYQVDWGSIYTKDNGSYKVSPQIAQVIGGGDNGGATVTKPSGGFNSTSLEKMFQRTTASGQSGSASETHHTATIAGGVVGCVAALVLLLGLFFYLRRRWLRRRKQSALDAANATEMSADATVERFEVAGQGVKGGGSEEEETEEEGLNAELAGDDVPEMDGDDRFERIVEMPADTERFELEASGFAAGVGKKKEEDTEVG